MDKQKSHIQEMEEAFSAIQIEEEEYGGLNYENDPEDLSEIDMRWCLVGRFLTDSHIDFQAMQHKMTSLWRPGRGLYVKQLDSNRFIFQFYHEIDIKRVIEGSPWTFGRFHMVLERLKAGDNPRTVEIHRIELWVQLHNMGTRFMSQRVVTDIGNYIGSYIDGDPNNFVGVWRVYLRIRVSIPLNVAIKRKMKLKKSDKDWCWVNFQYEAIPTFCFICGLIGHGESFCDGIFDTILESIQKPYECCCADPPVIMNALAWNCQGMGSPGKIQFLQEVTQSERPSFVVLSETISSYSKMERLCTKLKFDGFVAVEPQGKRGGVALFWKCSGDVKLLSMSRYHIDVSISTSTDCIWRLTGLYGEPARSDRHKTWELLRNLSRDANLPWCVVGDLKNITSQLDKRDGPPYPNNLIGGFNDCLLDSGLIDMDIIGHQFTWERGRDTDRWIEIRIDRVLDNAQWLDLFPTAKVYNLEGSPSDHSPLLVLPEIRRNGSKNKKFRFENAWLLEPACFQIVKDCWDDHTTISVVQKLRNCADSLQVWGSEITGCFQKRIKDCKHKLKLLRNRSNSQSMEELKITKQ